METETDNREDRGLLRLFAERKAPARIERLRRELVAIRDYMERTRNLNVGFVHKGRHIKPRRRFAFITATLDRHRQQIRLELAGRLDRIETELKEFYSREAEL